MQPAKAACLHKLRIAMIVKPLQILFWAAWASLARVVSGKTHRLYVGNLSPPASLHALEFDDESLELRVTNTTPADAPHAWITFNHDKTQIYGASLQAPRIASYSLTNNVVPRLINSIAAGGACFNHTSAFVQASSRHPYRVFTGAWPGPDGCGMSFDVDDSGSLDRVTDSWSYAPNSAIHGLALGHHSTSRERLYSADLTGDAIWTHEISPGNGKAAVVGKLTVKAGSHPRHLALHPAGKSLYAVMEAGNRIAAYSIDETTGALDKELSTFSLIPPGSNSSAYWSAEVSLSHDARYVWATARAQPNTNRTGYISAFLLDDAGLIAKRMFRVPTTTTEGIANAISPAPWGNEWAAMTDVPKGYVQIWKMTGGKEGVYTGAQAVARVDIADGGCCANAIWYD